MNNKLLKGITLTVFATLLTVVVLDQSGYFDKTEATSDSATDYRSKDQEEVDEDNQDQAVQVDTTPYITTFSEEELEETEKNLIMSTSKSSIVRPSKTIDEYLPGLLTPQ